MKYLHHKICTRSKIDGAGRRTLHSYENVPVDREQISLGPLEDLQIRVLCVTTDNRSCDHDRENESSDDSMSSLSNLISHQQGDVRYHLNSEQRETTTTSSNITDQSGCEQRLSQSTRNSPVKKVKMKLKRNHSSPVLETTKCLKLRSNNETNNDSVITV